ncbi:unnamed protein product [Moneuplotes crassus]|uniref:Uncharacterized protein n=1 Tax=Euplotes crassus TaxID=5936 RepID=A0AAD1X9N1_EUPCR|nr:unnamed protein product [Moneuplotes crassus]
MGCFPGKQTAPLHFLSTSNNSESEERSENKENEESKEDPQHPIIVNVLNVYKKLRHKAEAHRTTLELYSKVQNNIFCTRVFQIYNCLVSLKVQLDSNDPEKLEIKYTFQNSDEEIKSNFEHENQHNCQFNNQICNKVCKEEYDRLGKELGELLEKSKQMIQKKKELQIRQTENSDTRSKKEYSKLPKNEYNTLINLEGKAQPEECKYLGSEELNNPPISHVSESKISYELNLLSQFQELNSELWRSQCELITFRTSDQHTHFHLDLDLTEYYDCLLLGVMNNLGMSGCFVQKLTVSEPDKYSFTAVKLLLVSGFPLRVNNLVVKSSLSTFKDTDKYLGWILKGGYRVPEIDLDSMMIGNKWFKKFLPAVRMSLKIGFYLCYVCIEEVPDFTYAMNGCTIKEITFSGGALTDPSEPGKLLGGFDNLVHGLSRSEDTVQSLKAISILSIPCYDSLAKVLQKYGVGHVNLYFS